MRLRTSLDIASRGISTTWLCQKLPLGSGVLRSGSPLAPACTVIIKATYPLLGEPGRAAIESVLSGDVSREIDGEDEPHYPSDFVPYKPCGEFMVRGTAVRPANAARERFQARVQVGPISKAIDVVGNRNWTKSFWRFRPGGIAAVDRVPLSYRFAHGGPGHPGNPIGRGFETEAMPNLEIPGHWIESRRSLAEPAGFGPLDAGWIQRRKRFGSPDAAWVKDHWPWLPPTFDFRFFNAAPADQWCEGYWRGDEELLFENMHPEQPLLRATLPGLRARAFISQRMAVEGSEREQVVFREVPLALDTLWIDLESMNLVLVWRGITAVRSLKLADVEDLFVLAERLDEPVHSLDHYAQLFAAQFSPAEDEAEASALDEVRDEIDAKLAAAAAAREEIRSKLSAAAAAEAAMLERAKPRVEQAQQEFEKAMSQMEPMIEKARKLAEEAGLGPDGKRQLSAAEQKAAFDGLRAQFAAVAGNPSLDPESAARLEQLRGQIDNIEAAVAGISEEMAAGPKPEAAEPEPLPLRDRLAAGQPVTDDELRAAGLAGHNLRGLDFSGRDLTGIDLRGAELAEARFHGTVLRAANLAGANLTAADLTRADLSGANLESADFSDATVTGARWQETLIAGARFAALDLAAADFSGASGLRPDFRAANLAGAVFRAAKFSHALFTGAVVERADFSGANLEQTDFCEARAAGVWMTDCQLKGLRAGDKADFTGAQFQRSQAVQSSWDTSTLDAADFQQAVLCRGRFAEARLIGTQFDRSDLTDATFEDATLDSAVLTNANLLRTSFDRATLTNARFDGSNLYEAGLWDALLDGATFDGANLKRTRLDASLA